MYKHLSTNADALREGQPLTRKQIIALALLEDEFVSSRGINVSTYNVESVLHAFMCVALDDCVCSTTRALPEQS